MRLFKKPKWLKPELDEPKYWLHIAIISVWVYVWHSLAYNEVVEQYYLANQGPQGFIALILWWMLGLAIGDAIAHTVLKLD